MKIGVVYEPRPQTWPKFQWVRDALLGLGHAVSHLRSIDELMEADADSDVIFFEHREPGLGRKLLVSSSVGHKAVWIQWWFDLCIEQKHQPLLELYGPLMRCMDYVVVKEKNPRDSYRSYAINAVWGDQGCPAQMGEVRHSGNPEFDVVLFGTRMEEYRQRWLDVKALVDAGYKVAWAGDSGPVPTGCVDLPKCLPFQLPVLMSRSAVTLAVDLREDVDGYVSDRFWLATGAGACVVHRCQWDGPKVSSVQYRNEAELIGIVRTLRWNHEARKQIGETARREVMSKYTYERACERVLYACGLQQQGVAGEGNLFSMQGQETDQRADLPQV